MENNWLLYYELNYSINIISIYKSNQNYNIYYEKHIAFPLHYDFLIANVVAYRDNCFNIFMYFAWAYLLFIISNYIEKKNKIRASFLLLRFYNYYFFLLRNNSSILLSSIYLCIVVSIS